MKRILTAAALSLGLLLPAMPVSAAEAPAKAVCENEKLRLYYDADKQLLGLENRESGYIWWSSPLSCEDDPRATKPIITDLRSSAVLLSGDSTNRKTNVLRSGDAAVITAKERPDGVELTYRFTSCGVTVPVTGRRRTGQLCHSRRVRGAHSLQQRQGKDKTLHRQGLRARPDCRSHDQAPGDGESPAPGVRHRAGGRQRHDRHRR